MAQAKKKTATRTTKKHACNQCRKKACNRTAKKQQGISQSEKMHVYIITIMAMIAGILLCANAAMMIV